MKIPLLCCLVCSSLFALRTALQGNSFFLIYKKTYLVLKALLIFVYYMLRLCRFKKKIFLFSSLCCSCCNLSYRSLWPCAVYPFEQIKLAIFSSLCCCCCYNDKRRRLSIADCRLPSIVDCLGNLFMPIFAWQKSQKRVAR